MEENVNEEIEKNEPEINLYLCRACGSEVPAEEYDFNYETCEACERYLMRKEDDAIYREETE